MASESGLKLRIHANNREQPGQKPVNNGEQQVIAEVILWTYNMR
jgi:hypothetical protein